MRTSRDARIEPADVTTARIIRIELHRARLAQRRYLRPRGERVCCCECRCLRRMSQDRTWHSHSRAMAERGPRGRGPVGYVPARGWSGRFFG